MITFMVPSIIWGTSLPSPTTWTWSNLFTWYPPPPCVDHTSIGKRAISLQLKGFLVSFKFSENLHQENLVVGGEMGRELNYLKKNFQLAKEISQTCDQN